MNALVIACSLNPDSNSRTMARAAVDDLVARGASATLVDLREHPLPMHDGEGAAEIAGPLGRAVRAADAVVLAVPIYNYDVNAAAKNLVEHLGRAFEGKLIAFLCAAGGSGSYMSVMGLANSLMLDFRCLIVPRFVYATGPCFADGRIVNPDVSKRIGALCDEVVRLAGALAPAR
jgi:NAD(P)H-dependent FMN reductase